MSEAMQEGIVTDSTVARAKHEAVTAIHVDTTRRSQVDASRRVDSYSDLDIPYNVISRFDFILELAPDVRRTLSALERSFSGGKTLSSYHQAKGGTTWSRELQRIVSYMRTYWREVKIPDDVNQHVLFRVKEAFGLGPGKQAAMERKFIEDNIRRVSQSVLKFVKAITCADHNPKATTDDVDRAFAYVEEKIRFLKAMSRAESEPSMDPRTARVESRLAGNLAEINTPTFQTADYVECLGPFKNEKERKSARQQATRDLQRLVDSGKIHSNGHGVWEKLPEGGSPRRWRNAAGSPQSRQISKISEKPKKRKR